MNRFAARVLSDGFLHPAARLDDEIVDDRGVVHIPLRELDTDLQFFHCRVEAPQMPAPFDYVLSDLPPHASQAAVQRFLSARFPDATTLYLRSQDTGRATIECAPALARPETAAAAVAAVLCSAAADESPFLTIQIAGVPHVVTVSFDDGVYWVEPRHALV